LNLPHHIDKLKHVEHLLEFLIGSLLFGEPKPEFRKRLLKRIEHFG
jgi:hypothetical protein